ncbi:MAG: rhodanese-like domain-containing protein [Gammaproteobacteria bacterium]
MHLFSRYCQLGVFLLLTSSFAMAETDTVSPKEASVMQSENKAVIVDVREDDEWNEHHIHGAIHIPLNQLTERLAELEAYKNSPVITQCRSGNRSAKAQLALNSAGFSKVYNMNGGIQAWDEQGLATE